MEPGKAEGSGSAASPVPKTAQVLYKTSRHGYEIKPVKVSRVTKEMVFIHAANYKGMPVELRESKVSHWHQYHDTESAALDHLIERASRDMESYKRLTHQANTALGQLESRKRKMSEGTPTP